MSDEISVSFELNSPGGFVSQSIPDCVVYLHGFRSSPSSVKAQKVHEDFLRQGEVAQLWIPQLPASPREAMELVHDEVALRLDQNPDLSLGFIGSSLGGFYATVLAECWPEHSRALLLNPAVKPYDDLHDQTGRQKVYFSEEEINFLPDYLSDLKAMEPDRLTCLSRYCLVAASGDEVLDFGMMTHRYEGAHQLRINGSDHALTEFDQVWPLARLFLGLK